MLENLENLIGCFGSCQTEVKPIWVLQKLSPICYEKTTVVRKKKEMCSNVPVKTDECFFFVKNNKKRNII